MIVHGRKARTVLKSYSCLDIARGNGKRSHVSMRLPLQSGQNQEKAGLNKSPIHLKWNHLIGQDCPSQRIIFPLSPSRHQHHKRFSATLTSSGIITKTFSANYSFNSFLTGNFKYSPFFFLALAFCFSPTFLSLAFRVNAAFLAPSFRRLTVILK